MPTLRGWAALGASLALGALWIGFGERLLLGVALFLFFSVVLGSIHVRRGVPRVSARRTITPAQVHDDDRAVVEIELISASRVHQVVVSDIVRKLGSARFVAHRLFPNTPMIARYEVLSRPRGVYQVGPASVMVRDPLAMAEARRPVGRVDRLVVYPAVEDLHGLPMVRGQDPTVNTARSSFSPTGGDDFFTLREYQRGDHLRHVHWPSSAKRDNLMIKQLEMPWQSRGLVLLDPRAESYVSAESFEHAVRGAASALRHLFRAGFNPTLWLGQRDPTTLSSQQAYGVAMEALAVASTRELVSLPAMIKRLNRGGIAGGAFVLVTGDADAQDVEAYRLLSNNYAKSVVMTVAQNETEAILQLKRVGAIAVQAGPGAAWAPVWREAMESAWSTATAG